MATRSPHSASRPLAFSIGALLLSGCELLNTPTQDGMLTSRTFSTTTDTTGHADLDIDVADQTAFMLTATAGQDIAVESITDPDGNTVLSWKDWYGSNGLTSAIFIEGKDTVLNWPIRRVDGDLTNGTWTVNVGVIDNQGYYVDKGVNVNVHVKLKADPDFSQGTVKARIVYADGLADDPIVTGGVQAAVSTWKQIWGAYGLNLNVVYEPSTFAVDQPSPGNSAEEGDIAAGAGTKEITVFIGETIDGGMDYYGISGGIPGGLAPTNHSLVVISWLANSGGDGQFNADDIRIFGETLAHECGHYLGLFHPVETTYDYWDALSDTVECSNARACENDLGENLMFPYPVCDYTSCDPQQTLSQQQMAVTQRYTGTL